MLTNWGIIPFPVWEDELNGNEPRADLMRMTLQIKWRKHWALVWRSRHSESMKSNPAKSFTQSITSPILLIFCFSLKIKRYAWPTCLFQAGRAECSIVLDFLFIDVIATTTHWHNSKLAPRLHLLPDLNHQSQSYLHKKWLISNEMNYLIFWTFKNYASFEVIIFAVFCLTPQHHNLVSGM